LFEGRLPPFAIREGDIEDRFNDLPSPSVDSLATDSPEDPAYPGGYGDCFGLYPWGEIADNAV
jgi:hypothetical protein